MKLGQDILYLSDADVRAAGLGLAEVEAAVEAVLAAKAAGRAVMKPKLSLHAPDGALFLAAAGILGAPAYGGVKWVGVADAQAPVLPPEARHLEVVTADGHRLVGTHFRPRHGASIRRRTRRRSACSGKRGATWPRLYSEWAA